MSDTAPTLPDQPMTSDAFTFWSLEQPEGARYELHAGRIVRMESERWAHAKAKFRVAELLSAAVRQAGLLCDVVGDGMAVRIDDQFTYEPDAMLRCGDPIEDTAVVVSDPMIVVEVTSKSSRVLDTGTKLAAYFRLASLRHYLIVGTDDRTIIQHSRQPDGTILTRIIRDGTVDLDPPGIVLSDVFNGAS